MIAEAAPSALVVLEGRGGVKTVVGSEGSLPLPLACFKNHQTWWFVPNTVAIGGGSWVGGGGDYIRGY